MVNDSYFTEFPYLESERLVYRKLTLDDAPEIYLIRSNTEVMQYMDSQKHVTIEESEKFISKNLDTYGKQEGLFWALIEKSTNAFIGDFAYWRIVKEHYRAEIGYSLKPQFWGKGYMKEALNTMIKFGFNNLHLHSIEASVNPNNENSKNALLKMGFKKEAYFKENIFFNGNFLDTEVYSLLSTYFKNDK